MKSVSKAFIYIGIGALAFLIFWFVNASIIKTKETQQFNLSLQQLRSAAKLVIWEQDFQLSDITEKEKVYFDMFTASESVATTINGKMGLHIDLADSVNTKIYKAGDTLEVHAPLRITYVSLDLGTLKQIKESSLDPTLEVDKDEIVKHLSQKALEKYLPDVIAAVSSKSLNEQNEKLQKLTGKPIKIFLTQMPSISDWH